MEHIVTALIPIFLLILIGFYFKKIKFPSNDFWASADKLTYFVLMPSLLIYKLSTANLEGLKAFDFGRNGPVQTFACLKNSMFTISCLSIAKLIASLISLFSNFLFFKLNPKYPYEKLCFSYILNELLNSASSCLSTCIGVKEPISSCCCLSI